MDSVLCNNPAPDINASKPEALEILKLILGNNSMTIFDTQKNVDSTDGKIVILKPCGLCRKDCVESEVTKDIVT